MQLRAGPHSPRPVLRIPGPPGMIILGGDGAGGCHAAGPHAPGRMTGDMIPRSSGLHDYLAQASHE